MPRASLVLPTRNRSRVLARTLAALTRQRERDFEVVIADVTAAESDEPTPLALVVDAPDVDTHAEAPALIALVLPDAVKPAPSVLDDFVPMLEQEKPKKPRRRSKLKFGRFEGY